MIPAPTSAAARLLDSLDAEQRAAVESRADTLFVLAGPGSGKTRVITARLVHLLERRQVPSHQVACFVFSRAAVAEVKDRVLQAVGEQLAEMLTVSTFHAFALRLLRACSPAYLAKGEWPAAPWRVADEQEAEEVLRGIFAGPEKRPEASGTGISAVRNASVTYAAYGRWGSGSAWRLLNVWWRRLAERGLVTHDRLIPAAWEAMADDEGARQIVERFRHVVVDEAQDLTEMEWRLASTWGTLKRSPAAVTLVGDERQAIFGWRGATAFQDLVKIHVEGTEHVYLRKSYRCRRAIAEHANALADATKAHGQPIIPAVGDVSQVLQGYRRERLRSLVWEYVTLHGAAEVVVLARTNREAEAAAAELGDLARLVRREPDTNLRVAINALRLFSNYEDNAAARVVLDAIGVSAETLMHLQEKAGAARSLWAQALANGVVEGVLDAVPAAVWDSLIPILGEGWHERVPVPEALDILSDRREADLIAEARADGKVVVSTIHSAKGREADVVLVLTSRDWLGPRPKPEEVRVMYVACTRARCALAILEE